jgi:hypothetical protein
LTFLLFFIILDISLTQFNSLIYYFYWSENIKKKIHWECTICFFISLKRRKISSHKVPFMARNGDATAWDVYMSHAEHGHHQHDTVLRQGLKGYNWPNPARFCFFSSSLFRYTVQYTLNIFSSPAWIIGPLF